MASVTWTNMTNTTASGNELYKSDGTTGWDAGAFSTESINSGGGEITFKAKSISSATSGMYGLNTTDSGLTFQEIDFCVYIYDDVLKVYENGSYKCVIYNDLTTDDEIKIKVEPGAVPEVKYYVNDTLEYTSTNVPSFPLYFDTALNGLSAGITDIDLSNNMEGTGYIVLAGGGAAASNTLWDTTTTVCNKVASVCKDEAPTEDNVVYLTPQILVLEDNSGYYKVNNTRPIFGQDRELNTDDLEYAFDTLYPTDTLFVFIHTTVQNSTNGIKIAYNSPQYISYSDFNDLLDGYQSGEGENKPVVIISGQKDEDLTSTISGTGRVICCAGDTYYPYQTMDGRISYVYYMAEKLAEGDSVNTAHNKASSDIQSYNPNQDPIIYNSALASSLYL
jgi:hypothetical protein